MAQAQCACGQQKQIWVIQNRDEYDCLWCTVHNKLQSQHICLSIDKLKGKTKPKQSNLHLLIKDIIVSKHTSGDTRLCLENSVEHNHGNS